jgi:hypothetical protein
LAELTTSTTRHKRFARCNAYVRTFPKNRSCPTRRLIERSSQTFSNRRVSAGTKLEFHPLCCPFQSSLQCAVQRAMCDSDAVFSNNSLEDYDQGDWRLSRKRVAGYNEPDKPQQHDHCFGLINVSFEDMHRVQQPLLYVRSAGLLSGTK